VAFVVSPTVHHNAIIGILAKLLGADLPAEFRYAPSTVTYHPVAPHESGQPTVVHLPLAPGVP
jgi:hypothetical protein